MKKTLMMGAMLGFLSFACQSQQPSHGNTKKMQPAETQDQDYNQRRNKPRSQGGCCAVEELQKAPSDLQNKTAEAPEVRVETAE